AYSDAPYIWRLVSFLFTCFSVVFPPPISAFFPYTTLFRSISVVGLGSPGDVMARRASAHALGHAQLVSATLPLGLPFFIHRLFRSEEHTSELQSRENLVCRLLLEKKNKASCERLANALDGR